MTGELTFREGRARDLRATFALGERAVHDALRRSGRDARRGAT